MALIEYLVSKGKRPDSFENVFPQIHHFNGTMKPHINYITDPDAVEAYSGKTNQDVVSRMKLNKVYTDEFLAANPEANGINEFKYR